MADLRMFLSFYVMWQKLSIPEKTDGQKNTGSGRGRLWGEPSAGAQVDHCLTRGPVCAKGK
ncbi:MAG: hypothetical protein PHI96_06165 [Desulfovibrio sp.]|nr:hypothetical protein [Desulfovibrio sp.]